MVLWGAMQYYAELNIGSLDGAADYELLGEGQSRRGLTGLGRINFLVGPNNSGKSRFLRALFRAKQLPFWPSGIDHVAVKKAVSDFHGVLQEKLGGPIRSYGPVSVAEFGRHASFDWLTEGVDPFAGLRAFCEALLNNGTFNTVFTDGRADSDSRPAREIHASLIEPAHRLLDKLKGLEIAVGNELRLYIPVLRGLRPLESNHADLYANRTAADYAGGAAFEPVYTGLDMYPRLRDLLLGDRHERQSVKDYEDYLSAELFDGESVELIPRRDRDVVWIRLGERRERPIYDLGDGMQALIVLTFPAFTATNRSLLFVEEPETHLHPGMQRKLIEVFLRHERLARHQFFMTTHSNHLLDMASDYSHTATVLFRPHKTEADRFQIHVVSHPDRMVLDDLGVRASSVFLTNATIWVEGVTDRLYLREYLSKYLSAPGRPALREDTHYSFLEGGGSNIAHFDFDDAAAVEELSKSIRVARICSRSFVVLDGDTKGKRRLKPIEEALGSDCFVLKSKEIENLLPVEVLHAYIVSRRQSHDAHLVALGDYHQLPEPLGAVLDTKLRTNYYADGQTIKNKDALCHFAVTYMRDGANPWVLTPEADEVCRRLVEFVCCANSIPNQMTEATAPK